MLSPSLTPGPEEALANQGLLRLGLALLEAPRLLLLCSDFAGTPDSDIAAGGQTTAVDLALALLCISAWHPPTHAFRHRAGPLLSAFLGIPPAPSNPCA